MIKPCMQGREPVRSATGEPTSEPIDNSLQKRARVDSRLNLSPEKAGQDSWSTRFFAVVQFRLLNHAGVRVMHPGGRNSEAAPCTRLRRRAIDFRHVRRSQPRVVLLVSVAEVRGSLSLHHLLSHSEEQ